MMAERPRKKELCLPLPMEGSSHRQKDLTSNIASGNRPLNWPSAISFFFFCSILQGRQADRDWSQVGEKKVGCYVLSI